MGQGQQVKTPKPPAGFVPEPPAGFVPEKSGVVPAASGVWDKLKGYATKELIPAESALDSAFPDKSYPGYLPIGLGMYVPREVLLGAAKVPARAIQKMSSPVNAAMGVGAGLLGEVGLPGYILKALFSGKMLKDAYGEFTKPGDPSLPLHERIANKGSALADAVMALMPWKKDIQGSMARKPVDIPLSDPVSNSVTPIRTAVPKPVEVVDAPRSSPMPPAPIARPEPAQRAPYVPEQDPNYLKALALENADKEKAVSYQKAIQDMRTPPTTGLMEDLPVSHKPVGTLSLEGKAEEISGRKSFEDIKQRLVNNAADQKLAEIHDTFSSGLGELSGKGKNIEGADRQNYQFKTSDEAHKEGGFGKIDLKGSHQDILQGYNGSPSRWLQGMASKSKGKNSLYTDMVSRARNLFQDHPEIEKAAWEEFKNQWGDADDSPKSMAEWERLRGPELSSKFSGEEDPFDEAGFARIKDDRQKGFSFNPSLALTPVKEDNPLLQAVKATNEKPMPIREFHDSLFKIQEATRSSAKDELFNRVLSAPDSARMSKRELMGLDPQKSRHPNYDNLSLFGKK